MSPPAEREEVPCLLEAFAARCEKSPEMQALVADNPLEHVCYYYYYYYDLRAESYLAVHHPHHVLLEAALA
eukprot:1067056-Prorocentrum_minimum.AAC.2